MWTSFGKVCLPPLKVNSGVVDRKPYHTNTFLFHSGNKVRDRHIGKQHRLLGKIFPGPFTGNVVFQRGFPGGRFWYIPFSLFPSFQVLLRGSALSFVVHLKGMNFHFHYRNLFQVFKMPGDKRNTSWGKKKVLWGSLKNIFLGTSNIAWGMLPRESVGSRFVSL